MTVTLLTRQMTVHYFCIGRLINSQMYILQCYTIERLCTDYFVIKNRNIAIYVLVMLKAVHQIIIFVYNIICIARFYFPYEYKYIYCIIIKCYFCINYISL